MVLALSNEREEEVAAYVEQLKIRLPVASGFTGLEDWGVRAYPSSVLLDREGTVLWSGHPAALSGEEIGRLLK